MCLLCNEQRDGRKRKGPSYAYGNDSYDMEEIVMPLHEYVNHPVAMDIVHNGATFQVKIFFNKTWTYKKQIMIYDQVLLV